MAVDQSTPARSFRAAGHTAVLSGMMACVFLIAGVFPSGLLTDKGKSSEKGLLILRGVFLAAAPLIACTIIREYRMEGNELRVRRLLGSTRISLNDVCSVERLTTPDWENARRTGGIGYGWDARIGNYRGYVTDMRFAVVLRLKNETLVISPEDPEEFLNEMNKFRSSHVDVVAGGV